MFLLENTINAQIIIRKIGWSGVATDIVLDSVLTISRDSLISNIINDKMKLPIVQHAGKNGMYLRSYLFYNNKIIGTYTRNEENPKFLNKIPDKLLKYILPYLKLKSNCIYIILVRVELNQSFSIDHKVKYKIKIIDFRGEPVISIDEIIR